MRCAWGTSHIGRSGAALELHQGGPPNLRTMSPEFGIDAKREELSILTGLPNPIASGFGVLHRPAIDPQNFSRPPAPESVASAPGSVTRSNDPCRENAGLLRTRPTYGV
jgi:hypothetical protein